jgi:hypothetical protein
VSIADITFHIAKGLSSVYDLRFGGEFGVPYGPEEIDFKFSVVNDSSSPSVLANAIHIAASATSQRILPWSVPIGFACFSVASKIATARPSFWLSRAESNEVGNRHSLHRS